MTIHVEPFIAGMALIILIACTEKKQNTEVSMKKNTLMEEWNGSYGGVPAFDNMNLADLEYAMEKGMAVHLEEIESITQNSEPPTFENTLLALERSGTLFDRINVYYNIWNSNLSSPEFREIQKKLIPKLADYRSKISQNKALFERIKTVYENSKKQPLSEEQQRVTELTYLEFVMNGALLDEEKQQRYTEINKRLSELYNTFSTNVLHDEENYVTYLDENQLDGLPQSFVASAKTAAEERNQNGKYAVVNTRSSIDPFLTYSTERELRETVWRNYYSRGDNNDAYDNHKITVEILKLRNEKAHLLGYENFAEWRLQNRMAKNPDNAMHLLETVWQVALARVAEEVAEMQAIADAEGSHITMAPWDYRFYAEKVRKAKYDLNSDEVKQYLELNNLTEAIFYVAEELFEYRFSPITDGSVPVFHEDVKVWKVTHKTSGEHIGIFYLDPYARPGKRSGAWATQYRSHANFDGKRTVLASNNSNFVKPAPGEAVLISWDDAETFFHEFGHALHYFSSRVTYPSLNGGVRDYTEFQSQLLERWLSTDAVINQFLKHHETNQVMPAELVEKIKKTATFNQGFSTTEYLASALMDMIYHTTDMDGVDLKVFEKESLENLKMPEEIVMRHRTPHFSHIFSSEGYAAGYYGYLWADVLTSDAAEAFRNAPGGFYDKDLAQKLVTYLFAPRNAIDPAEAYRLFRGRDATIDALMRDRGFPIPDKKE